MKVFLTGGSGFVGYHVADALRGAGWEVVGLVRAGSKTAGLEGLGVELCRGELGRSETYAGAMAGCDAAVHCAGAIKAVDRAGYYRVNADGAAAVAEGVRAGGVKRLVQVSSVAARGPVGGGPVSLYGESKLAGETAVETVVSAAGTEWAVLRPPPVYGPRDAGMLPVFRMAGWGVFPVYGLGSVRMGVLHVRDLAAAVVALLAGAGPMPRGPFYPEDGCNVTWTELCASFREALGRKVLRLCLPPLVFRVAGGASSLWQWAVRRPAVFSLDKVREMECDDWGCSGEALTAATGWRPRVGLVEGLRETYQWYRREGWL